ncbi:unnamed protein product [Brassicogethes aeneus]|uniref:Uncharacterized protein n=1 Tax=Brassicogethes aeneus TaxID=1431903 RepID=A0A9P0B9A7_BRAAE|nr:unnamed protein product [Brassicogethes aeneus]
MHGKWLTCSDIKTRTKKKISDNKKEANKTGGGPNTSEVVDKVDNKILEIIGGDVVIEGLDIPELGIATEGDWDHQYFQEQKEQDVAINKGIISEEINNNKNVKPQPTVNKIQREEPTPQHKKRVRPPIVRPANKKINMSPKSTAFDLVQVTERTNQIKETYYHNKLQQLQKIHEENLELRREDIQLKKMELPLKEEELQLSKQELALKKDQLSVKKL